MTRFTFVLEYDVEADDLPAAAKLYGRLTAQVIGEGGTVLKGKWLTDGVHGGEIDTKPDKVVE